MTTGGGALTMRAALRPLLSRQSTCIARHPATSHLHSTTSATMLKTQSGKRQREKLKNQRATARSMHTGTEGHVREVVEEPAHGQGHTQEQCAMHGLEERGLLRMCSNSQ